MLKQRVAGGSGSDYFVYDDLGRMLGVYDSTGAVREELVWFDGWRPVMTARGTGSIYDVYRIVSDRQQIPVGVLDATGTRVWEWDGCEPYSYQLPNQDKDGDSVLFYLNLRMPGQWFDSETGLYHNGFRDYDPKVGRYIQPDPIGLAGGWNEYAYVGSDPVEGVDPYGLAGLWLERGVPGEGGGGMHMSVNVGDGTNSMGISFGTDAVGGALLGTNSGYVYEDKEKYGEIFEYYSISDQQEKEIRSYFDKLLSWNGEAGVPGSHIEAKPWLGEYDVFGIRADNCRTFSRNLIDNLVNRYNLKMSLPHAQPQVKTQGAMKAVYWIINKNGSSGGGLPK